MSRLSAYRRPVRFELGTLTVSPQALQALLELGMDLVFLLQRHHEGDYGASTSYEEMLANEGRIEQRGWVRSRYKLRRSLFLEVITLPGWGETKVLLEGEPLPL